MSTETALTMQDLELETAELLPSRETLHCFRPCRCEPCFDFDVSICCNICL
jgi:hypothetical protein